MKIGNTMRNTAIDTGSTSAFCGAYMTLIGSKSPPTPSLRRATVKLSSTIYPYATVQPSSKNDK